MFKFDKTRVQQIVSEICPEEMCLDKECCFLRIGQDLLIRCPPGVQLFGAALSFCSARGMVQRLLTGQLSFLHLKLDAEIVFLTNSSIRMLKDDKVIAVELPEGSVRDVSLFLAAIEAKKKFAHIVNTPLPVKTHTDKRPYWYVEPFVKGRRFEKRDMVNDNILALANPVRADFVNIRFGMNILVGRK